MGSKFVYPKRRNNHFVYEWWIECLQGAAARHSLFFGHLMSQQLTTLHQVGRGTLVDGVTWVCSAAAPAEEQIEVKCLETTDWGDIETVMKWPLPLFLFFSLPLLWLFTQRCSLATLNKYHLCKIFYVKFCWIEIRLLFHKWHKIQNKILQFKFPCEILVFI